MICLFSSSIFNNLIIIKYFFCQYINFFFFCRTKQDKSTEIPSPPGYTTGSLFHNVEYMRETDPNHLIMKKSWDLALGPLKQVPMNLFIMYMAGNSISIFPIMMVCMLIIRPVKALFTLQQSEYLEKTIVFLIETI